MDKIVIRIKYFDYLSIQHLFFSTVVNRPTSSPVTQAPTSRPTTRPPNNRPFSSTLLPPLMVDSRGEGQFGNFQILLHFVYANRFYLNAQFLSDQIVIVFFFSYRYLRKSEVIATPDHIMWFNNWIQKLYLLFFFFFYAI